MFDVNIYDDFSDRLNHSSTLSNETIAQFQGYIHTLHKEYNRVFPWRETTNPYHIVVSEIMLQQTQVNRAISFYQRFTSELPDFKSLAQATPREVLALWSGLGYNRRGLALHAIAQSVMHHYAGLLPTTPQELLDFPGIGPNTAGSIAAFAFNYPSVFIETNIRTVFLHSFFRNQSLISDKQIMPLIEQTLDKSNPRMWYYALMDYGTVLKKNIPNPNRKSKHYTIQSKFIGSNRRVRGAIIRQLTQFHHIHYDELLTLLTTGDKPIATSREQFDHVVQQLCREKIVVNQNGVLQITI